MNPALLAAEPFVMAELGRLKAARLAAGLPVYDFGVGDPIEPTPPFIREALVRAVPAVSQYPSVAGTPELRRAAAGWVERRFGVRLDPDTQILPTMGSKEAIFHLPMVLVDPAERRRRVVYPTPAYPIYEPGALFAGAIAHPVPLSPATDFVFDLEALPPAVREETRLLYVNYPHNPTGKVVGRAFYERLAAGCQAHGIVLASDECYVDLAFEAEAASVLEVTTRGVLAFFSLSKRSGMTGYRSGFVAGDPELIARYRKYRAFMGVAGAEFVQGAAVAAWSDDGHVAERRAIFRAKRELMRPALERLGYRVRASEGTFFLWLALPPGGRDRGDARAHATRLLEAGILVAPGDAFGPGGEGHIRVALVPPLEACREALAVWERVPL
ncbi:MAG TPA: succinyldiaminopimelate transaminase [Thermodesulfobacteriota bacterium]|nr:succinyldiaminopimelate transaminase [Thermodesulfobacteriota bacterium]